MTKENPDSEADKQAQHVRQRLETHGVVSEGERCRPWLATGRVTISLILLLLLPVAASADVVIFTNGTRMQVQEYEIKNNVVVITTMDGKLQTIPSNYIDLDATERSNRPQQASPAPPPTPPATEPAPARPEPPPARPTPPPAPKPVAPPTPPTTEPALALPEQRPAPERTIPESPASNIPSQPAKGQESHWGVTASFVPTWKPVPELYDFIWDDSGLEAQGKEFRIGVVRGSDLGGDWSVTFVRNWFATDQVFDETFEEDVFFPPDFTTFVTVTEGSIFTIPGDVEVFAVKYEKFTPFVTIKDRVQIGLTYGVGIGSLRGTVVEQRFEAFDPDTGEPIPPTETIIERDVKEFYIFDFVPIGSVEAAVAFILAPGLKARVTGGFNYPNTQVVSFTVNYLFGASR